MVGGKVAYKVLVVDDSSFFQTRLRAMIDEHPLLKVIGVAANGQEAIEKAEALKPDIITMDYEMPYLDGVSAVRAILAKRRVPIVMFSSLTYEGAKVTLDALDAGAVDFIPKNFAEISRDSAALKSKLHETLLMFLNNRPPSRPAAEPDFAAPRNAEPAVKKVPSVPSRSLKNKVQLLIIGASTGGPVALTEVVQKFPAQFPLPVVIIQHMPENFTKALAERLNRLCAVRVVEAKDGDVLQNGVVYIAPGGHQLMFSNRRTIRILAGDERVNYKPSVDVAFASAANQFGAAVLGVVLTGMGADGREGARLLKQRGAFIWGQDRESCVIYGMPKAIADAGLADEVVPLAEIGNRLVRDL